MLKKLLKAFSKHSQPIGKSSAEGWHLILGGSAEHHEDGNDFDWVTQQPDHQLGLATYLASLLSEGKAHWTEQSILIHWADVYALLKDEAHQGLIDSLQLPDIDPAIQPILNADNRYGLSDHSFEPLISGWRKDTLLLRDSELDGAVLHLPDQPTVLLPEAAWRLANQIQIFTNRPESEKNQHAHELAWGRLRQLSTTANATYASRYLESTFIVTPESLKLGLERSEVLGETIIRVNPDFEGAPIDWLQRFDQLSQVQDAYDFASSTGQSKVILSETVKQVLQVIKRDMPNRRVVGKKAEAFIRNPYALLGESAFQVIDEESFEQEKEKFGTTDLTWQFKPIIEQSLITQVYLRIDNDYTSESVPFHNSPNLQSFLTHTEQALVDGDITANWQGYRLLLDGNSHKELEQGERIIALWQEHEKRRITAEEIYDLSGYGDRVIGIGELRPVAIPILLKDEETDTWMPEMEPGFMIQLPGSEKPVILPAKASFVREMENNIQEAKSINSEQVELPGLHFSIPVAEAEGAVAVLKGYLQAPNAPDDTEPDPDDKPKVSKKTLIPLLNFTIADYIKQRTHWLQTPENYLLRLPLNLRGHIKLKDHQLKGVQRLQYLAGIGQGCDGILLADDMGLGKTLQILCLLAEHFQTHPTSDPALIIAPVTLLDNWEQEVSKFFDHTFPPVLRLHGKPLQERKQPKALIDEQLKSDNITKLLVNDWLGDAKLVISTYETIRDYEFSVARQNFEFIICDEAQKIKNPKATSTLAIKKQKGRFKIACTGTPVENNLIDLWCLFDWIQPGLLGTIQEFHSAYRHPIETQSDEEKRAINNLVDLIDPQIIRRTKQDISADLPEKIEVGEKPGTEALKKIPISAYQYNLYQESWAKLGAAQDDKSSNPSQRVQISWTILHRIKAICAEPYCLPGKVFLAEKPDNIKKHLDHSPKINWLLSKLGDIKQLNEKVIIFTELRQVQIAIGYFIQKEFGFNPKVVNGDTKKRQALIDQFQSEQGFNTIILSPLAAGAGLNIVEANHVIHFTRTWNPAKEAQATDRAYRIGQKRDVHVYRPTIVARHIPAFQGLTFEEKLDSLMQRKTGLSNNILDVLQGTGNDIPITAFTESNSAKQPNQKSGIETNNLDGIGFEVLCALVLEKQGWDVKFTPKTGDGGVDLIALKSIEKTGLLIQCKSSMKKNKALGIGAAKDVIGGAAPYEQQYRGITMKKVAATNQLFNKAAQEHAKASNALLWDKSWLTEQLLKYPVSRDELDRRVMVR